MNRFWLSIFSLVLLLVFISCNKDEVFTAGDKPVISFDHEDGIYSVKLGDELTLAPDVKNGDGAEYIWTLDDGTVVCQQPVWTHTWNKAGEHYVLLTVSNLAGIDREEVRIDVIEPLPPSISLPISDSGLVILKNSTYVFSPIFGNVADGESLSVEWFVDDVKSFVGNTFEFCKNICGEYKVVIRASNSAGCTEKEISVQVVEKLPISLDFMPLSVFYSDNERTTIVGRPVAVSVIGKNVASEEYKWTVDGSVVDCANSTFVFTPEALGVFCIAVEVEGVIISMVVNVVEAAPLRQNGANGATIIEYIPAPGQFIGETNSIGGMSADITTHDLALNWANERLAASKFVSLGAWGGYLVAHFDRSVINSHGEYDFSLLSNAITSSNEPGIVWVMQDVNRNGKPDDEWYELRGSDFSSQGSSHVFATTYFRPSADAMPVQWQDVYGTTGTIEYLAGEHSQPSYYPAWIENSEYTLYGSILPPRNEKHPVSGMWSNNPFDWGYADNLGSDFISGDTHGGAGTWIGFKIANAVLPNGVPVDLDYIDFVKIQTGVMTQSDNLGELSTEVLGIKIL